MVMPGVLMERFEMHILVIVLFWRQPLFDALLDWGSHKIGDGH